MKKFFFISLFIASSIYSQVIISPYIVYMDQRDRFGTFLVQNKSLEEYEINISFVFGYPTSDSLGNGTMKYIENPSDSLPSIAKWIRAFPRSFVLVPEQKQIVRMTVRPPSYLPAGTYWTRMITSSAPKSPPVDTVKEGISAKIRFVLNQVTTVVYRVDTATTSLNINDLNVSNDSANVNLLIDLKRGGNSAYFGKIKANIFNEVGDTIATQNSYVQVYYDMFKKIEFPVKDLAAGKYRIEVEINFNEKDDIPKSRMVPEEYTYRKEIEFNYPIQK